MSTIEHEHGRIEIKYDTKSEKLSKMKYNGLGEWIIKIEKNELNCTNDIMIKSNDVVSNDVVSNDVVSNDIVSNDIVSKNVLPSVDEIITYISNKPGFKHDSAELQTKFIGRILNSRKDQKLYYAFDARVRKAKEQIRTSHNAEWEILGSKSLGKRQHIKIFGLTTKEEKDVLGYFK